MKCLTCGYSVEDVKMMEDHCKYLQHLGYVQEGEDNKK